MDPNDTAAPEGLVPLDTEELTPVTVPLDPRAMPGRRRIARLLRPFRDGIRPRRLRLLILAVGLVAVAGGIPVFSAAIAWWAAAVELADSHAVHAVAHPGWSFPARVIAPAPKPDGAPEKLLAHARALGYVERCGTEPPRPGELCTKTKRVNPRNGSTLEPLLLGWLIGPDGELREHLPIQEAPQHLLDAIVAAEDREFLDHAGVNLTAMARAVIANLREGSYAQGGSTLTMQIVRTLNQRRERTVLRKIREIVMAAAIDHHLGKRGVLQMYLDAPYLGQRGSLSIAGFEAASQHYFGKRAKEMTLAEAATLAAILPAPAKYAPDRVPEIAKQRRDRVLKAMEKMGWDVSAALLEPVKTVPPPPLVERYPAYLSALRAALEERLAPETIYGAGLVITPAIDVAMQEETEKLFPAKLEQFASMIPARTKECEASSSRAKRGCEEKEKEPLQAAAVLLDVETGRIRAIFGGTKITSTDFNRATQARRQGGSAFKPVVYALAMTQQGAKGKPRFTAATTEPNTYRLFKTPQGDWRPRNVGGEYSESACLAQALAWSQNIATASLLEQLGGPKKLIEFANTIGFDASKFPAEMGLALGQGEVTPLEMAELTAMIARGGVRIRGTPIESVVDARGMIRLPPEEDQPTRVMSPEAAAVTRELMRLVIDVGTGGASRGAGGEAGYQGPAMGKTGTTDGEKDLWFIGATPKYAASVWLGYDRPQGLGASASDLAAPLWGWWLHRLTKGEGPPPAFPAEPKLVRRAICTVTGKIAGPDCRAIGAPFIPGTEPRQGCSGDHPPDEIGRRPAPEEEAEEGEDLPAGEASVHKPQHESIWKRLAREREESRSAAQ